MNRVDRQQRISLIYILFTFLTLFGPLKLMAQTAERAFHNQAYNFARFGGNGSSLSWDGRLALRAVAQDGWALSVIRPQAMTIQNNAVNLNASTVGQMVAYSADCRRANPQKFREARYTKAHEVSINSVLLAMAIVPLNPNDPGPYASNSNGARSANGDFSTYEMRVYTQEYFSATCGGHTNPNYGMGFVDLRVVVSNPNTATANIQATEIINNFRKVRTTTNQFLRGIEPTLTFDGKLFLYNANSPNMILYTYNPDPSNPNGWSPPASLLQIFNRRNESVRSLSGQTVRFGDLYRIANQPIRFADGAEVPRGTQIRSAYPWINLDGDDVFFTTVPNSHERNVAIRALRAGQVVVGASTNGMIRHLDGGINRDRYGSLRLVVSSFGKSPGKWVPHDMNSLPLNPKPHTMSMLQTNTQKYFEVSFYETLSNNFDFYFPMNEAMGDAGVANNVRLLNYRFRQAQDISGNFHPAIHTAKFSDEFIGADGTIPNVNYCTLRCDDKEDRYSGKAMYFQRGNSMRVPLRSTTGHTLLNGSHAFTFMFAIRPMSRGSAHYIAQMEGVFKIFLAENNRIKIAIKNNGIVHDLMSTDLPVNQWSHVAISYDGRGRGTLKTFVDGRLVSAKGNTGFGSIRPVAKQAVVIGPTVSNIGGTIYALDQVAMSPRDLSPAEIRYEVLGNRRILPSTNDPLPLGLKRKDLKNAEAINQTLVALGEQLFFDPRISGNGNISCSTCHQPGTTFSDGRVVPRGLNNQLLLRNTPSIYNLNFSPIFFHDGRTSSVVDTVRNVMSNKQEFGSNFTNVVNYMRTEPRYVRLFSNARQPITINTVFSAIGNFVSSLKSANSKHDRVQAGLAIYTASEQRGRDIFNGRGRCGECHTGSNFTDGLFHNIGIVSGTDPGRSNVTGLVEDQFQFKTPSLRNVALTAPYFHNGSVGSLRQVVVNYNNAANLTGRPRSAVIKPLGLTNGEIDDVVNYLETLNGVNRLPSEFPIAQPAYNRVLAYNKGGFRMLPNDQRDFGQSNEMKLAYQTDGNLVLYRLGRPVWSTGRASSACTRTNCQAVFQTDGNLVLYQNGRPYWTSATGRVGNTLTFRGIAPVVIIRDASNRVVFQR